MRLELNIWYHFSIPNILKISWTLIMTNYTLAYSDADEIFTLPLYSCYSLGAVKSFRVWWWCISYMFTLIEVLPIVLIFVMECKKPGSIKKGSKHIYFIHCIVICFCSCKPAWPLHTGACYNLLGYTLCANQQSILKNGFLWLIFHRYRVNSKRSGVPSYLGG